MTWVKGQSGNPTGRTGTRNRLTERLVKELDRDFRKNGARAIQKCREEHPEQYLAILTRLLPKDAQLTVTHELSQGFMRAIQAAQHTTSSEMPIIDVTPERVDDANPLIALDTQRSKDSP